MTPSRLAVLALLMACAAYALPACGAAETLPSSQPRSPVAVDSGAQAGGADEQSAPVSTPSPTSIPVEVQESTQADEPEEEAGAETGDADASGSETGDGDASGPDQGDADASGGDQGDADGSRSETGDADGSDGEAAGEAEEPAAVEEDPGTLVLGDGADVPGRVPASQAAFPLRVSADQGLLLDRNGVPFLVNGDAAWSMIAQLDGPATDEYLQRRRQQGFNTLLVNLIEHRFSDDPPNNTFGQAPFLAPGDFSQPNPVYFQTARAALDKAAANGFMVLLTPAYLGFEGGDQGFYQEMVAAGPDVLRDYGRFVGQRFGDLQNVIWLQGGDFTIPPADLDLVEAVRQGILDSGATQLHTAHWSPETSGSDVGVGWLDLNTTYTYGPVHAASLDDNGVGGIPHVVLESKYEDDIFGEVSTQRLRAQAYEAVLTNAIGSIYGHGDIWQFSSNWRGSMDARGAGDMAHAAEFFESIRWFDLQPAPLGEIIADRGTLGWEDFISVAHSADRSMIAAYLPVARGVQVDLQDSSGTVLTTWFDPANGTWTPASTRLVEGGQLQVDAPGQNSDGDTDWALLVRIAS